MLQRVCFSVQGHFAHKKHPPHWGLHKALGIVLVHFPRGGHFLVSEVPLYRAYELELEVKIEQKPAYTSVGVSGFRVDGSGLRVDG